MTKLDQMDMENLIRIVGQVKAPVISKEAGALGQLISKLRLMILELQQPEAKTAGPKKTKDEPKEEKAED